MNLQELYDELKRMGVPDSQIYLHGIYGSTDDDNKLSMIIKMNEFRPVWEVYYRERGVKDSIREFTQETEACMYYLERSKVD